MFPVIWTALIFHNLHKPWFEISKCRMYFFQLQNLWKKSFIMQMKYNKKYNK